MTVEFITADQTSPYTIDTDDQVFLTAGVTMTSATNGFEGDLAGTASLTVDGNIYAGVDAGDFFESSGEFFLRLTEQANVVAEGDGFIFDAAQDVYAFNAGTIAVNEAGFYQGSGSGTYVNTGSIVSAGETNQGAIFFSSLGDPGAHKVNNSGVLSSMQTSHLYGTITSREGSLFVVNSGEILSAGGVAILATSATTETQVVNSGMIDGDIMLVTSGNEGTVFNSGQILGDVLFNDADDVFNGSGDGTVSGVVMGEAGNDTLRGASGADTFQGGDDDDLINGGGGDDLLEGEDGNDLILGGDGNDLIDAGAGQDTVNGNAGDDTITGSGDSDLLRGGRDDDVIRGGGDEDTIRGDSGDDLIVGEAGRDNLFGGSGNDVFLFESLGDSGLGAARDRIFDFRSGEDTLDISQIVGPVISYIGSANFSGSGGREVRTVSVSNGTLVYLDTDGDGNRDSDIYLIGTASVTEGDFLL